jgi:hypothetical protein
MSFLGSVTAGSTGTFRVNYVPEFVQLSSSLIGTGGSLQVAVDGLGDSILVNLDEDQLANMKALEMYGAAVADAQIRLANGELKTPGGQCVITLNNQSGVDIDVAEASTAVGTYLVRSELVTCLAGSNREFSKFSFLHCGQLDATGDIITIEYQDGHVENNLAPGQLPMLYHQRWGAGAGNLDTSGAAGQQAIIDNSDASIKRVNILAAADTIVGVRRIVPGRPAGLNEL